MFCTYQNPNVEAPVEIESDLGPPIDINAFLCEYAFMRTTLELPDPLFRKIKAKAAMEGVTLKHLLTVFVENGLESALSLPRPARRSKLPVIKRRGKGIIPNLTPELQSAVQEEEDLAKLGRSFGR